MTQSRIFDSETVLPDERLTAKACTLLGFDARYARIRDQLRLLLSDGELGAWNKKHHGGEPPWSSSWRSSIRSRSFTGTSGPARPSPPNAPPTGSLPNPAP